MNNSFHRSATRLGLSSVVLAGLALAGCNSGSSGSGGGASMAGGSDTLATVGNSKVTRADLADLLIAQNGEQVLPYLIDTQLVMEGLKAKNLDVSDAEVEAGVARRQKSDPSSAPIIAAGGGGLDALKRRIRFELGVQKLITADIKPTEAQVKSFFDKNQAFYDVPAQATVGMLLSSTKTRAALMAQQLQKKTKTLAQLVAEQKKAKDPIAGTSAEDASKSPIWPQLSRAIMPLTQKLPKGAVTPVEQLAAQAFGVFVVTDKTAPVKANFAQIRADVEADYKAAEVARKTVSKNPTNPPFDETLRRTFEAVRAQSPTASLRDVLNYINQTEATTLMDTMRASGTVQVDDPTFATVAKQYQAATPTPAAAGAAATGAGATGAGTAGAGATGATANNSVAVPSQTTSPAQMPANDKDTAPNGADKSAPEAVKR